MQLAQLRENSYRWYIEYHCPERKRPTFGLNRILNIEQRRRRGQELCDLINWWMIAGLPIDRFNEVEARRKKSQHDRTGTAPRGHTDVRRAIYHAVEVKEAYLKNEDSTRSYTSHSRLFVSFLESKQWELMPVDEIRKHHIVAFLDHRKIEDQVRNTTINNNITSLNALFEVLLDREFILTNPCSKIKKLPAEAKNRRPFTTEEAKAALPYIYQHDKLLLLAILMEYCCYMRPKEIRLTKRKSIDLLRGIISIPSKVGKTGRKIGGRVATIPTEFLPYFVELMPSCRPHSFIFGKGFIPNQREACNKNRMYKRHLILLKKLKQLGILEDISGLTLYSWKDAGITDALAYLPLVGVQDQAGHTKPDMTLKYYKKPDVNEHILGMRNDVLPQKKGPTEVRP